MIMIKESWHYQYFLFLKKTWGLSDDDCKSNCRYIQGLWWGSLLTLMTFPLLILGWLLLKLNRAMYKALSKIANGKIVDFIDKLKWGPTIECLSEGVEEAAALACLVSAIVWIIVASIIGGIAIASQIGIMLFLRNILEIPGMIGWSFVYLFWAIFMMFSVIWALLSAIVSKIIGGVIWIGTWFINHLVFFGWFLLFGAIAFVVIYSLVYLFKRPFMKGVREFFVFKINGFAAARESAKKRKDQEKKPEKESKRKSISLSFDFDDLISGVVGFLGILLSAVIGFSKGICVPLEVISKEELEQRKKAAKQKTARKEESQCG